MDLGLIGLGKMGGNMRERLRRAGHTVVGFDRNPDVSDVDSLEALVEALPSPKVVWVMVPAGDPTRATVKELAGLLGEGDVVVDGGEMDDHAWLHPTEVLARRDRGEVDLAPPTWVTLHDLAEHADVDAVLLADLLDGRPVDVAAVGADATRRLLAAGVVVTA